MNILNQETILEFFRAYFPYFVGCLFLGTFALTYYLIPKVLWVSKEKNLMASVNDRSAHTVATPSFGGVAFYMTLVLVLCIIQSLRLSYTGNHLVAAITILFMVGLKDDLVISTARVKLFGQIAATCFLIFSPELQLTNLHGFWGVYEIPEILGYCLNAFIVIGLINAYNLIDGIDGLAAMVGIVVASVYGVVFYRTGNAYFALVSISVVGVLTAFLRYNFSRGTNKIFMGDSGSLIIGLILGFLSLKILVMDPQQALLDMGNDPANRLLLIAAVLFIPVFDTLRVMILRMIKGASPFAADRNHAHHVLLDLGFSHFRASLCLALFNLLVIAIYFYASTKMTNPWLSFLVVFIYGAAFSLLLKLKVLAAGAARPTHSKPTVEGVKVRKRPQVKEEYS